MAKSNHMENSSSNKLIHLVIRTAKADSAFVYFQFEANEGLCFFSTVESSLKTSYRDIEIFSPLSLEKEFRHMISYLGEELPLQILKDEVISDHVSLTGSYS